MAKTTTYTAKVVIEKHVRDDGVTQRGYADNPIVYQKTEASAQATATSLDGAIGKLVDRMNLLDDDDFINERVERAKGL